MTSHIVFHLFWNPLAFKKAYKPVGGEIANVGGVSCE